MCRRFILAFVLVFSLIALAVFPEGSRIRATGAQSDQEVPPWRIAEVTDTALTPERIASALPSTFGDNEIELEGGQDLNEQLIYPFSTKSYTYGYIDGTPGSLTVNIADIGSERTVAKAIDSISLLYRTNPYVERFEVKGQDTSATANVPFLRLTIVDTEGAYHVLVWGSKDGEWVFSISAGREDNLEELVRTLVVNLQEADGGNRTAERVQPSAGDAEDLVDLLLETPFRGRDLPFGTDVAGARLAPEGPTDASEGDANLGPFFGLGIDVGTEAWINMTVTAPPEMGSVYLQYAVFSSPDAAERALYSDDIFGRVGRFPFGTELVELDDVPEFEEPAVLWVSSNLNSGSETRLPRASVQAGVVALSGDVLVLTSVSAPVLTMDTTAPPDPTAHAVFAIELSLSAIDHVDRLPDRRGADLRLAASSDQLEPGGRIGERALSAKPLGKIVPVVDSNSVMDYSTASWRGPGGPSGRPATCASLTSAA